MRTIPRARLTAAAVGVVAAGLLSGCGVADRGVQPGVAAEFADTTISQADVEQATEDRCEVLGELAGEDDQPVSGARVRDLALQGEVLREVAGQLAEEYDVESGQFYDNAQAEIRSQLEGLDEDLVDRVMVTLSSTDYFVDILIQVGRQELGISESDDPDGQQGFARGARDRPAVAGRAPDHDQPALLRHGDRRLQRGCADHPRRHLHGGQRLRARRARRRGGPVAEDPAYAASLPESQRCG